MTPEIHRAAVIGGGISGLAAAHRFVEKGCDDVVVLEASNRIGGVIASERAGDLLLEGGPDSFISEKPRALELCRRIGLEDQLIPTNDEHRRTLVVRDGALAPLPEAFQLMAPARLGPFLRSSILSWPGRIAALKDLVLPRGNHGEDESLASFVRRRLGNEILERIAQPLIGGIYTADPETLSLAATMPRFLEMERKHRSVILALFRAAQNAPAAKGTSGARFGMFFTLRDGLSTFPKRISERLPAGAIRTEHPVHRLTRREDGWLIESPTREPIRARNVVVALPAPRAAEILSETDAELSRQLGDIQCASTAIVSLAYRRADIPNPPRAFGIVVPFKEGRRIVAASFSSVKFDGRAPDDHVLLRIFVGGGLQPELFGLDDDRIATLAREEMRDLLGVQAEPVLTRINRWPESMPQYRVGHLDRVDQMDDRVAKHPGLALAGNAYRGVGLADCVRSAEDAVDLLLDAAEMAG